MVKQGTFEEHMQTGEQNWEIIWQIQGKCQQERNPTQKKNVKNKFLKLMFTGIKMVIWRVYRIPQFQTHSVFKRNQ